MRYGPALLLAVTAAVYLPTLLAGFVWDDPRQVVGNLLTGDWRNLPAIFTTDLWATSGVVVENPPYYRPLLVTSFLVDRLLWGLSPAGHHLQSVLWHLAAVWAVWALLRDLVAPIPALVGAAVFALHPIQSEAVVWVSARNDPMAAFFVATAARVLLPADARAGRVAAGGLLLLAGLLSKEQAVLGVVLVAGLDVVRCGRPTGGLRWAGVGAAVLVWAVLRAAAGVGGSDAFSAGRLGAVLAALPELGGLYGRLLAVPWPLTSARRLGDLHEWWPGLIFGWAAALAGGAWLLARGRGLAAAGLAFAAATFAPSLLGIGATHQVGERYLYVPLIGIGLALAASVPARKRSLAVLAGVASLWIFLLVDRLPDWRDPVTWTRAQVEDYPSGSAYGAHALALRDAGQAMPSLVWFRRALDAEPPSFVVCAAAVETPLARGDDAAALGLARLALARGCPVEPALTVAAATAFARAGAWREVRSVLAFAGEDPVRARLAVVWGALAVVDGQRDAWSATAPPAASPDGPGFRTRVAALLALSNSGPLPADW
ncbi:MAG: hypothetical protein MJE66_10820 [Proteobacteria bacterium]|nr:hypothetical protein [Pseudomonadota bacterium]